MIINQHVFAVSGTWNPGAKDADVTLSGGNLTASVTSGGNGGGVMAATGHSSGHYYFEITLNSGSGDAKLGIAEAGTDVTIPFGQSATGWDYWSNIGFKGNNNSGSAYGASFTNGDVIGVEYNSGTLIFRKNNTSQGTAFTGISNTQYPCVFLSGFAAKQVTLNVGGSAFAYSPPSGAVAWG